MVEFGTNFERQRAAAVAAGISDMARHGYDALVFSYEDDGNFARQVRQYRLIAAKFGTMVARRDGFASGNIVFFKRDDGPFLAVVLRLFLGFLPPHQRGRLLGGRAGT